MKASLSFLLIFVAAAYSHGMDRKQLPTNLGGRAYEIHRPPTTTKPAKDRSGAQTTWPVVIALHPLGTDSKQMAEVTAFNSLADSEGFVVVYGVSAGRGIEDLTAWNAGTCCTLTEKPDDVAYVAALVKHLTVAGSDLDSRRVYLAGMSNGAMLVHRVAADSALCAKIAAMGTVAGTIAHDKPLTTPCPWIHFHGTMDTKVPFKTGIPEVCGTGTDMRDRWLKNNQCSQGPTETAIPSQSGGPSTVKQSRWTPSTGGQPVVLYVIEGGGHTWPGGPVPQEFRDEDLGAVTQDVKATDTMWAFFKEFQK